MTNVGNYTDEQILIEIKKLPSFKGFSGRNFLVGVRSKEREYNIYDDKIYSFNGNKVNTFVFKGTTESGAYGVKNFFKWNKKGFAEIKSNECYYNVWTVGKHKNKMKALKQTGWFKVIRKKSWNDKTKVWEWESWKGLNFHCNSYNRIKKAINWIIGGWSTGCQVTNEVGKYYKYMGGLKYGEKLDYYLLDEF